MNVSRKTHWILKIALALVCVVLYVGLVRVFDLGNPWKCFGTTQLRAFLPSLALLLIVGDLFRFLNDRHEKNC